MLVFKNTFNSSGVKFRWPGLLAVLLCASYSYAQQTDPEDTGRQSEQKEDSSRRIDRLGEVVTEEWQMDLALPQAVPVGSDLVDGNSLPDPEQDQALQSLLSQLAANPGSSSIFAQLTALLSTVLEQANELMDAGSLDEAAGIMAVIQSIDPDLRGLDSAQRQLPVLREVQTLQAAGNAALLDQRLVEPENDNAYYYFSQALVKNPQNQSLQTALGQVQDALIVRAHEAAQGLDFELAAEWLTEASGIRAEQAAVNDAWVVLAAVQNAHAQDLEERAIAAMNSGDYKLAEFIIIDLIALGGSDAKVQALRVRLEDARYYGGFDPGDIIEDEFLQSGNKAPAIVVMAAGSFMMGSSGYDDNQKPRHRVTIEQGFGFGIREVSVAEFRLFIESSRYRTAAEKKGNSKIYDEAAGRLSNREGIDWEYAYNGRKAKPEMPVLHVNWYDAQAYVQWLSKETGKSYRLPTEAEYEYVAKAGGRGSYWWGEGSPGEPVENLTGERDSSPGQREWTNSFKRYGDGEWGPAATGSLTSEDLVHPMGVHDIAGNVAEWVEDCWHQNYMHAPVDGSAWVNPGCNRRVARGGYWASGPVQSRAAHRISASPDTVGPVVGIRIARDL